MLITFQFDDNGHMKATTPMKSIMINHNSNTDLMAVNFINIVNIAIDEYSIEIYENPVLSANWKVWLNEYEISSSIKPEEQSNIINKEIILITNQRCESSK